MVNVTADHLEIKAGEIAQLSGIVSNADVGQDGTPSAGDAGDVHVVAGDLRITGNTAQIASLTFGKGDGGKVTVDADRLVITATDPFSRKLAGITTSADIGAGAPPSEGNAGDIVVRAREIDIAGGGAQIASLTFSKGDAGAVSVFADRIGITGDRSPKFAGIGTNVDRLAGSPPSEGDAGTIRVEAREIALSGDIAEIGSRTLDQTKGAAGAIRIVASRIRLHDGADILSSSAGEGVAGEIVLRAAGQLIVDGGAISTSSVEAGGGEIRLVVGEAIVLRNGEVSTSVAGGADPTAGNILVDPRILAIDGGSITADAPVGSGGRITLVADNVLVPNGDFAALLVAEAPLPRISATGGVDDGEISLVVGEVTDLSGELVVLEGAFLDASALLRERCDARRDVEASSFTGAGRGGLPADPDGALLSGYAGGAGSSGDRAAAGDDRTPGAAPAAGTVALLLRPCRPLS